MKDLNFERSKSFKIPSKAISVNLRWHRTLKYMQRVHVSGGDSTGGILGRGLHTHHWTSMMKDVSHKYFYGNIRLRYGVMPYGFSLLNDLLLLLLMLTDFFLDESCTRSRVVDDCVAAYNEI